MQQNIYLIYGQVIEERANIYTSEVGRRTMPGIYDWNSHETFGLTTLKLIHGSVEFWKAG
jgi:hypothetical protein